MIKDFHGKVYYVQMNSEEEAGWFIDLLFEYDALADDIFRLYNDGKGTIAVTTVAACGEFRGNKHIAWESAKNKLYRKRRES